MPKAAPVSRPGPLFCCTGLWAAGPQPLFLQIINRFLLFRHTGNPAAAGGGQAGHSVGELADPGQFLLRQLLRLFPAVQYAVHGAAAENIAGAGGINGFQLQKGRGNRLSLIIFGVDSLFAQGDKHELHPAVEQGLRAGLHGGARGEDVVDKQHALAAQLSGIAAGEYAAP